MRGYELHHILVVALVCLYLLKSISEAVTYSAGVVEFSPDILQPSQDPTELILRNAHRYINIINTAAEHDVDILVFPECGLTSLHIPVVRKKILPYLTKIPEVGTNPCDNEESPQVLKILSCAVKKSGIYVVFNLDEQAHCQKDQTDCPSDGFLFYNSNLALDRNGTIVAKYRKFNLFVEPEFNITKIPDHSWFDTDFGVRFGMFICFDILFKEPSFSLLSLNISNFVYSTAWFSELPFLTATPVQAGWAYSNDVNLLASGYSNTINKNAGSGIYAGRDGTLIATMPQQASTKLLISKISADQRGVKPLPKEEITFSEDHTRELNFFHDDLEQYSSIEVTNNTHKFKFKEGDFSCSVITEVTTLGDEPVYRIVAFTGTRSYALVRKSTIEVCGVVACANSTLSSCGQKPSFKSRTVFSNISISMISAKPSLISYPISMNSDFLPSPPKSFEFNSEKNELNSMENGIKMNMVTKHLHSDLLSFSIFRNE